MNNKIEPCPFCGQCDALVEQLDSDASVVICQGLISEHSACLARGPVGVQDDDNKDQPGKDAAIREWNQRALLAEPVVERESLEKVDHPNFLELAICETCAAETLCREISPSEHQCGGCYWAPIAKKVHDDELGELQATIARLTAEVESLRAERDAAVRWQETVRDASVLVRQRDALQAEIERFGSVEKESLQRSWQAGYDTGYYGKHPAHERTAAGQQPADATHFWPREATNRKWRKQVNGEWCEWCGGSWLPLDHPMEHEYLPAAQSGEPVAFTAVGVLRDDGDGGLAPEWILEGGTAELWAGAVLLIADEDQELCAQDGHCELYREQPAPAAEAWPILDTPAKVGPTRFGKGVSSRLVVEAAQRQHVYDVTPEKEALRIAKGTEFLAQLHAVVSAVPTAAPTETTKAKGYCNDYQNCECGGDSPGVRATCDNWVKQ